jgi:hypothetical protein
MHYNLNQPYYDPTVKMSNGNFPRPYAFFNDITYYDFCGNSFYNSGTVTVRKRLTRGAFFRANYTFGKSLDNASQFGDASNGSISGVQNTRNLMADYGRSDWDRRHAFTMNFVADLPYRQFFMPEQLSKALLRGWQLSGSGTAYSGQAFTVTANSQNLNLGQANRPDRVAFGTLPNPGPNAWYDINAFPLVPAGAWRWGNSGRNILDGPGQMNLNFALMRNFQVGGDRGRLQFRWEAFNATNHTNLKLPVITVNTANAATITSANNSRNMQVGLRYQF